ncbi:discoidin domain-containing protein [Lysinibacillus sp. NPDC093692]|uniref:discoidin domain-containing protein n=1 Tax=Lysinibacillus sp. NPDC093692 TaxID=3390578 RepID=UPI003D082C09
MNWYLKIEGTGGGTSGSGINYIEVYDQKGNLVKLTKGDVIETNATTRNADDNYLQMLQTKGSLPPYNGVAGGIFYTIKLPDNVEGFAEVFLKNWGNTSYDIRNIKASISKNNIEYEQVFDGAFATGEGKTVLQNYSLGKHRMLLQSKNKIHSLESIDNWHEPKMTSDTSPAPIVASASSIWSTTFPAWKAFNGTNNDSSDCWVTVGGSIIGWIQIDFGIPTYCNQIKLTSRAGSTANACPKDFIISASNDGVNFDEIVTINGQTKWALNETRMFTFKNDKKYHIYRLTIISNDGYSSYSAIGKLQFGYKSNNIIDLPKCSLVNFETYGKKELLNLIEPITINSYVLQDIQTSETFITEQLNKKPLSISFK